MMPTNKSKPPKTKRQTKNRRPFLPTKPLHTERIQNLPDDLSERIRTDKLLANRNYLLYLSSILQKSQIYHLWRHYLSIFRKFKLVSLLLRIYSWLLVLLQFGTAFVVIVIGILILLPILLLSAVSVIFSALLLYRRENQKMERILKDKKITVFFPTRDGEFERGNFWQTHMEELANRQSTAVLIVSPFFWSGKGINGNRFYFLLRKEKENIYLVRKHYYFSLRQKILNQKRDSLTLIY